ncbi:MAG: acetyl-CoA decarbonylase/synthase complex subunit gamma [Planctomycetota bacterium]
MALTGLEIFKLLPKSNCKKCGMPTCLAFAMQLAQKKVKLEDCPCASEEAKQQLAAAAAPPMRLVKFGPGQNQVQIGQETVLFRHEEKFYNPTAIAVTVSDGLTNGELEKRVGQINALRFERVGTQIGVKAVALLNNSGSPQSFAKAADTVCGLTDLALILVSDSPQAIASALDKTAKKNPLIASANSRNVEDMAKIAKQHNCPLVAEAPTVEALADLTEKIKSHGVEDIVLTLKGLNLQEQLYNLARIRVLSLKKIFRLLGYPSICFVEENDPHSQLATAVSLICKYAGIVVVNTAEPYAILPMLTTIMNIYTDPQKPVQVEPKIYDIGEPDGNAPLLFTTNFSLTYYTVESDVEASRVPTHILVVDTEGTSVLTAYSGDKLNEKTVADAMTKNNIQDIVKHRKLIIPGYVAVMSGKLEEATGWEIMIGPRESSMLPKYLQEVWK